MKVVKVRNTIGYHITNEQFSNEFQKALDSGESVAIHLNTPGGSVWHGWEMFNEMRMAVSDGADIHTYNIGLAASMGSVLFLGAPKENRHMAENSMFMIHEPKGLAFGDEEDMKREMQMMGKIGGLMAKLYAKNINANEEYARALMKRTTWYKPSEAKKEGFFNKIVDGKDEVEDVKVAGMDKTAFAGMPSNCGTNLCFMEESPNIKGETSKSFTDLTKITNSQMREKIWMNFSKH